MTQRPDRLTLSLGAAAETRRSILHDLAAASGAIGRNGVPSISELLCNVADAYQNTPAATLAAIRSIRVTARDPMIRDAATGAIVAVRITSIDGNVLGLADASAANPIEFEKFAKYFASDEEE